MRIGVSGHQDRQGLDWVWTRASIDVVIRQMGNVEHALTSLAIGADTAFAEVCQARKIPVTAVVPLESYERFFEGAALRTYHRLLAGSEIIRLPGDEDEQRAFLAAGQYVVDHSDALVAIWDEQPAGGIGGTADIVAYAQSCGRPIHLINPLTRTTRTIDGKHHQNG